MHELTPFMYALFLHCLLNHLPDFIAGRPSRDSIFMIGRQGWTTSVQTDRHGGTAPYTPTDFGAKIEHVKCFATPEHSVELNSFSALKRTLLSASAWLC